MKNGSIVLLIGCLVCGTTIFGQETAPVSVQNLELNKANILYKSGYKRSLETVGSIYDEDSQFREAFVANNSQPINLRYSPFLDQFEFLSNGKMLLMGKEDWYSPIIFPSSDTKVILATITEKSKSIKTYLFSMFSAGDLTMYRRSIKVYDKGSYATSTFDLDVPNQFREVPTSYYLMRKGGELVAIPSTKKKLIKHFPTYKSSIEKNIKNDILNDEDLKVLLGIFKDM